MTTPPHQPAPPGAPTAPDGLTTAPALLFVCTGNATRSVIAGALAATHRPAWTVRTAGTLVIEGRPLSWRTREALAGVGVDLSGSVGRHATRQLDATLLATADLVVCMEADQVRHIRRTHPEAAARTATLPVLVRDLRPGRTPLRRRVAELGLADRPLSTDDDVPDPGGGEVEDYHACARNLDALVRRLLTALD